MDGFPGGPYRVRLKLTLVSWARMVLGGPVALLMLYASVARLGDISQLLHEQAIWNATEREQSAHVEADVAQQDYGLVTVCNYDLRVGYEGRDALHHGHLLSFPALCGNLDFKGRHAVRLAKDSDDDFALGAAIDMAPSRWTYLALILGWGLVVGGSLVRVGLHARAELARARRAGAEGAPLECRIKSRTRLRNFGHRNSAKERVTFEVPGKNGAVEVTRTLLLADGAIVAFDHGATLLAIVPREHPQDAVVLRDGYAPFDLPAESRRAADAAVAGRKRRVDEAAKVIEPHDGG